MDLHTIPSKNLYFNDSFPIYIYIKTMDNGLRRGIFNKINVRVIVIYCLTDKGVSE